MCINNKHNIIADGILCDRCCICSFVHFLFFLQELSKRIYIIGFCDTYVPDLSVTKGMCVADLAMCVK